MHATNDSDYLLGKAKPVIICMQFAVMAFLQLLIIYNHSWRDHNKRITVLSILISYIVENIYYTYRH